MAIKARLHYMLPTKKELKKNKIIDRFLNMIEKDTISNNNKKKPLSCLYKYQKRQTSGHGHYRCDGRHYMKIVTVYEESTVL